MTPSLIAYAVVIALVIKLLTVVCQRIWRVRIGDIESGFVLGSVVGVLAAFGLEHGHLFSVVTSALIVLGYLAIRISIRRFAHRRSGGSRR